MFKNKYFQYVLLIGLAITPIVLWLLPSDFFDESEFIVCPSRAWFDIECLGCGMTRAVMHMHHLEIEDALYFNVGSAIVYPALAVLWFVWMWKLLTNLGIFAPAKSPRS